jgi:glutamate synthase domain-containing protein 3
MIAVDVEAVGVRALNQRLHALPAQTNERAWRLVNPRGAHALACGLSLPLDLIIDGPVGYYCGGMNSEASLTINGNAGPGVGENMMSGTIHVRGNASSAAGASGHGGLLVIDGDAASRCGISMKGIDIVVGGSVGHMSAFMAQAGSLVVLGDAGPDLGDSIYEARLYVRGSVASLGADCKPKAMTPHHLARLARILAAAGMSADPKGFRRYGSARRLYNFKIDHAGEY